TRGSAVGGAGYASKLGTIGQQHEKFRLETSKMQRRNTASLPPDPAASPRTITYGMKEALS
ncbi:hypothetical protein NKW54_09345, partial [Acetobacter cerevisiae]